MKKVLSLILAMTMVSTSTFATTADINLDHTQMIAKTFNEFRYKMTVNSDSSNTDYQTKAAGEFKQRLFDLQAKGVGSDEIMTYMRSNILDASARKDFDTFLTSMDQTKISSEEAGNLAMQFMAKKYQEGASYSGGGTANYKGLLIVVGIVIVGVVTYCVWRNMQTTSTTTNTTTNTNTQTTTETTTDTFTDTNTCTYTNTLTVY